jgi:hypothetical protein
MLLSHLGLLGHLSTMGAIGQSMALLGIGLLWTYRTEAREWLREFIEIRRGRAFHGDPRVSDPTYRRVTPRRPAGALILISAVVLVFLGQILFLLDLTF